MLCLLRENFSSGGDTRQRQRKYFGYVVTERLPGRIFRDFDMIFQIIESNLDLKLSNILVKAMVREAAGCVVVNMTSWLNDPSQDGFCCSPTQFSSFNTDVEGDPMIYIVVMLCVFSAGIASLMIIYMKKVCLLRT